MAEVTLTSNGQTSRLLFTGDIGRVRNQNVAPGKVVHSFASRHLGGAMLECAALCAVEPPGAGRAASCGADGA